MTLFDCLGTPQRETIEKLGIKMDVTNIAEYYFQHEKEIWRLDDFPRARPPFNTMWVEYRVPTATFSKDLGTTNLQLTAGHRAYFGCFISTEKEFSEGDSGAAVSIKIVDKRPGTPGMYGVAGGLWLVENSTNKAVIFRGNFRLRFDLKENGDFDHFYLPSIFTPDGSTEQQSAERLVMLHPVFMAFSFANCKNIEIVQVEPSAKLNKRRVERGKKPLIKYSVINVLPFGKSYKRSTRSVSGGQGVALSIRRGNFASYGDKYGRGKLFGKYEGMFWRPQTKVGHSDNGEVKHDYVAKVK